MLTTIKALGVFLHPGCNNSVSNYFCGQCWTSPHFCAGPCQISRWRVSAGEYTAARWISALNMPGKIAFQPLAYT